MFGTSDGAATDGTDRASRLCPSAGCVRTSFAAIVVTPPGRFSTIARQFSVSDNSLATIRLMMSGGVLAEFGATKRIVPLGNAVCALAGNPDAARATITATCRPVLQSNRWVMGDLPLLVEFSKPRRGYS